MNLLQFIPVVSLLHTVNLEKNSHTLNMHLESPGIHSRDHTLLHQYIYTPSVNSLLLISRLLFNLRTASPRPTVPELPDELDGPF